MIANIVLGMIAFLILSLVILRILVVRGGRGVEISDPTLFVKDPDAGSTIATLTGDNSIQLTWHKPDAKTLDIVTLPANSMARLVDDLAGRSSYLDKSLQKSPHPNLRRIYKLTFESGEVHQVAPRFWPLPGIINLRDLGGYKTSGGQTTVWGKIYRTGHLGGASAESLTILSDYGISLVCDLRSKRERTENPDRIPESAKYLDISIYEDDQLSAIFPKLLFDRSSLADQLGAGYIKMLDERPERFGKIISSISSHLPAMFHCTAGKDRVGLTSAMILTLLGVPRETIIADFTLSNLASEALFKDFVSSSAISMEKFGIPPDQLRPLFAADPAWMTNALDHLDTQYGGVERYLKEVGKLSQQAISTLREQMLV